MKQLEKSLYSPIGHIIGKCVVYEPEPGKHGVPDYYLYLQLNEEPVDILNSIDNARMNCITRSPIIPIRRTTDGKWVLKFKTSYPRNGRVPVFNKSGNEMDITNDMLGHGSLVKVGCQVLAWESEKMSSIVLVLRSVVVYKFKQSRRK